MAIVRWSPWNLDRLFEDDWDFPNMPASAAGQGLNLYETEDSLVAEAALPGITEDKLDVTFENGVVRISGSAEEEQEDKGKRRYFMSSMSKSFNYSFRIPEGMVQDEEPEAELEDGILRLKFKKAQKQEPKRIKVSKKTSQSNK